MRVAVIHHTTGTVDTVIDDPMLDWSPNPDCIAVPCSVDVAVGDRYVDGAFIHVEVPVEDPTVTLGQLLDISIALGVVTVDEAVTLLGITAETRLDADGMVVVDGTVIGDITADAVTGPLAAPGVV